MPDVHALLGASSAERWMQCPPSAMMTADMPDHGSPFAAEGTLAHAVGELKLREHFLSPLGVKRFAKALQKLKGDTADDTWKEILHCTDEYLDAVIEIATAFPSAPYVAVEQRVAFDEWVPEGFGTADCVMVCGDVLHIVDYKHGKGVAVDAENNPQMMLYALGAYRRYLPLYPIKTLRWTIVQPRNGGISEPQEWTVADLVAWADTRVRLPAPCWPLMAKASSTPATGTDSVRRRLPAAPEATITSAWKALKRSFRLCSAMPRSATRCAARRI